MQVDPIKPTLKAPGLNLLKLNYNEPPSNFAFKFKVHHYSEVWAFDLDANTWSRLQAGAYTRPLFSST